MYTEAQATDIAKTEFAKHGRSVAAYVLRVEQYTADEQQWIVWFTPIGPLPTPGDTHAVLVHKSTGRATFMQGE
jgi:hypothetical protein